MTQFSGAYTALITPFTEDGSSIDFDQLKKQIEFQADGGVQGVVPCGTTGESPTLSHDEQRQMIEKTIEFAKPLGLQVIAGTGANSTSHAIELHQMAYALGADAGLQVNPYYNKPSQEGLYQHFSAVADSCHLPIVLYNVPGRSGVALKPTTVARLFDHENIHAIKEATGSLDSASAILNECDIILLSGDDSMTLPFASIGGQGVISVVANLLPDRVAALCDEFLHDHWGEARHIHLELFEISQALLALDTNPIPIKVAMQILNRDSGQLRLPMCWPKKDIVIAIEELLSMNNIQPPTAIAGEG